MSTSAHERKCCQFNHAARDIANSLFQKWAIKGFFPAGEQSEPRQRTARRAPAGRSPRRAAGRAASGVAVPPAFFGPFFRFDRKDFSPRGRQPHHPRRSRRVSPRWGLPPAKWTYIGTSMRLSSEQPSRDSHCRACSPELCVFPIRTSPFPHQRTCRSPMMQKTLP